MGRILVIRGGALGDFILTLPVLALLRARFPGARIEVLGYPHIARLAHAGGLADAVHPIESRPLAGFFARNGALSDPLAAFFDGFAVILSFLYDPDGIFQANVARCTRAQFIAGPHRPEESDTRHAVDTFLAPLERLAIFETGMAPSLDVNPLPPGPGAWLAAHPGSGSESKNWPEQGWSELLRRVIGTSDFGILLLGGEAEGDRLERLASTVPPGRLRIARSQPLDDVARLLRGCSRFIGHDSGITHLAAAVGTPCLALWGPSNAAIWRPRGQDVHVLRDDGGLHAISADRVWEILGPALSAAPTVAARP